MRFFSKLCVVAGLFSSTCAFANGYGRVAFLYSSDSSGNSGTQASNSRTLLDLGAGYIYDKGWTIGGLYSQDNENTGGASVNRTAMGPTAGWISRKEDGPYILGTYFMEAKYQNGLAGTGFQIDVGYRISIKKFSLGPQLSKKYITYDKLNGQPISTAYVEDKLDPYFVFMMEF